MTGVFVGVDVGTTRVKATVVDERGAVRGEAERLTPWRRAGARVEVDPLTLAAVAQLVAGEAVATSLAVDRSSRVLAIGVTGMAETGVLVDGQDRPLAPAIAWYDPRGDVETIARELGVEAFRTTTGLPLSALPSLAKLLWLRRNEPDTKRAARFYSIGDWVVRQLGGEPVAELSLASRTGLLDVGRAQPWDAPLALLDLPALLPAPIVAGTAAGRAEGEGIPASLRGAVLTVAGHDHQVAAYGLGAANEGGLLDSLGTAEALVRTVRAPLAPERIVALTGVGATVGWGVLAGHLCVLAGLPTGLILNRIALLVGARTSADRAALGERALLSPADQPALGLVDRRGEQPDDATAALLWRFTVDGLAAESARLLAGVNAVTGPHREVVVAGGWLRNAALMAAKRRQYPGMRTTAIAEPGAYGAALLAAAAAGVPLTATPATTYAGPD
jgi:sugar (pentulose or hexulose) kinase